MNEAERVPQLVEALLAKPLKEQRPVRLQSVMLLPKTGEGDDGGRPAHLRLPEHVRKDRDAEILVGHPPELQRVVGIVPQHLL